MCTWAWASPVAIASSVSLAPLLLPPSASFLSLSRAWEAVWNLSLMGRPCSCLSHMRSPAATRSIASTRSIPETISVTGCSTCNGGDVRRGPHERGRPGNTNMQRSYPGQVHNVQVARTRPASGSLKQRDKLVARSIGRRVAWCA
eukprot:5283436-Pleurochrysis_carterae.AAC.1